MDLTAVTNLGTAGFAILVMWWMYQHAGDERKRHDDRLDKKDDAFNKLNDEVRTQITVQLQASTSTLRDNMQMMQKLAQHLK